MECPSVLARLPRYRASLVAAGRFPKHNQRARPGPPFGQALPGGREPILLAPSPALVDVRTYDVRTYLPTRGVDGVIVLLAR